MEERQVTFGGQTYALQPPFVVLATQNPIEQEGTYPLPEAQLDRFMLKVIVKYPDRAEERVIMDRMSGEPLPAPNEDYLELFKLHSVIEVNLVEVRGKWMWFEVADGRQGWIPESALEVINQ